jgi:hypothetical protein
MFSCLTPTPFWKPIIASYRSPRLRLRKRCRNISSQHLRLTEEEPRSLFPILRDRSADITLENRSTQNSEGQDLSSHIKTPLSSVRTFANPSRATKYRC